MVAGEFSNMSKEISKNSMELNKNKETIFPNCFKSSSVEQKKDTLRDIPRHISTINESYKGKTYPGTDVKYQKKTLTDIDGKKAEGVFPKFNSLFDVMLPERLQKASDTEQFKYCTQILYNAIKNRPELSKFFNTRQIEQIKNGEPRISGLTWHHNEKQGKMQLVDAKTHSICRHTGGRSIWGGGSANR